LGKQPFSVLLFCHWFGAAALHLFVNCFSLKSVIFDASQVINAPTPDRFSGFSTNIPAIHPQLNQFVGNWMSDPTMEP
jgi:hypothetical protein